MKLDSFAGQVYVVTVNEARLQGHEFVTPEHFLYSALMFDEGKEIIGAGGGDIKSIVEDLQQFFKEHIPKHMAEGPIESSAFVQLFEAAAAQANTSGSKLVTVAELLSAIFFLRESHAQYILIKNGLDRLAMIKYISEDLQRDQNGAIIPQTQLSKQQGEEGIQYTVNLCQKAMENKLDPLIGRLDVIDRSIQVLCRRLKNNPIHVGDPGVGKTAIAEGLAQRIVSGDVPELLKDAQILQVDMGTLIAGTKFRGDFEDRLVKLLETVSTLPKPILYIDEIHTVVGAGAVSGGAMDATGIIKPYLAKGDIRFIGSTTYDEFKKHFEKDRALARRFQRIDISEPSKEECVAILNGLKDRYESYHKVSYSNEIIELIADLSARYMTDRRLPDKAIDVLDEAGVLAQLDRAKECNEDNAEDDIANEVTRKQVECTVAGMAKVPENSIAGDEIDRLRNLENSLNNQVFGQEKAAESISQAIKAARSGLNEPGKPVANLLFVGPTGVGKTEIAKQLASILGISLSRFDMSEYQERHAVARLIGAPPGYVGFEEGGLLTEAIRRTPHCVLLLDEIEKAHPDILNVLLQVMDYGRLTDNTGRQADFANVILIMTSNAGAADLAKKSIGFGAGFNISAVEKAVEKMFSPEFRNRLDAIIKFNPVDEKMAQSIAQKSLDKLVKKLAAKGVTLTLSKSAVDYIAKKGLSETYGAREIIRVVENDVKKLLVNELLFGKLEEKGEASLHWDEENNIFNIKLT
ncbi:MAG: AAA family ATPase [Defluviitaleaceae bacterium]|nr:AAA family ATPase [Defluviitaleaceae bacterium]